MNIQNMCNCNNCKWSIILLDDNFAIIKTIILLEFDQLHSALSIYQITFLNFFFRFLRMKRISKRYEKHAKGENFPIPKQV